MAELMPCPFCGGEAVETMAFRKDVKNGSTRVSNIRGAKVVCKKCLATSGTKETEEKAVEAWNRRASK